MIFLCCFSGSKNKTSRYSLFFVRIVFRENLQKKLLCCKVDLHPWTGFMHGLLLKSAAKLWDCVPYFWEISLMETPIPSVIKDLSFSAETSSFHS